MLFDLRLNKNFGLHLVIRDRPVPLSPRHKCCAKFRRPKFALGCIKSLHIYSLIKRQQQSGGVRVLCINLFGGTYSSKLIYKLIKLRRKMSIFECEKFTPTFRTHNNTFEFSFNPNTCCIALLKFGHVQIFACPLLASVTNQISCIYIFF